MALMTTALLSAPAEAAKNGDRPDVTGVFDYNQNVQFSEIVIGDDGAEYGLQYDGTLFPLGSFVNFTTGNTWYATKGPSEVVADWSDDLILHQWRDGQKVRTEVVLRLPEIASSVYTVRAHFTIEQIDPATGAVIMPIYDGTSWEGLYVDGPTDAYSAEINQLGQLLYGYNWNTKSDAGGAGYYKLTFSIDAVSDVTFSSAFPYTINEWCGVTITDVADYAYVADGSAFTLGMTNTLSSTSIIVQLL
jgi:hypothetical protein